MNNNNLIKFNEENRRRTINYLIDTMAVARRINHTCSTKFCSPKSISYWLKTNEVDKYRYDKDVFVCLYQKVHICDSCCIGDVEDNGCMYCSRSGRQKINMVTTVEQECPKTIGGSGDVLESIHSAYTSRSSLKSISVNAEVDNFYNKDYLIEKKEAEPEGKVKAKNVKTRNRNSKITKNLFKSGFDKNIIKIMLMENGIGKGNVEALLHSYDLDRMTKIFLENPSLYKMSVGGFRLSKLLDSGTEKSIVSAAENVLEKVLPGINRIITNMPHIRETQCKLYADAYNYIESCINKKLLVNRVKQQEMLDFDVEWRSKNFQELGCWATDSQWTYYIQIILNVYKLCMYCGQIQVTTTRKCIEPINHALGVIYMLKHGFYKMAKVDGKEISITIIPRDRYLNQSGILLETNKLGKLRKMHNNGTEMLYNFLDFAIKIIPPIEIRKMIFS